MPDPRTVWLRRAALMGVVAVVVAIPVTLVLGAGEDPEPVRVSRSLPPLNPGANDRGLRVRYQVPKGWQQRKREGTLRLQSRDGSVLLAISAPAGADRADQVRNDLLAAIRSNYDDVEINRGRGRRVGGLDAEGAVVSANQPETGGELRILVAVAEGKRRAYVVQVFTAAAAKPNRVRQAQAALNSLRLRG